jgi:hypothetical protein
MIPSTEARVRNGNGSAPVTTCIIGCASTMPNEWVALALLSCSISKSSMACCIVRLFPSMFPVPNVRSVLGGVLCEKGSFWEMLKEEAGGLPVGRECSGRSGGELLWEMSVKKNN